MADESRSDDDLRSTVEGWLCAMGCTPVERPDPNSRWHLSFEYPLGSGNHMIVAEPGGPVPSVVVASVVRLSERHLSVFEELDDVSRREFLFDLRRVLNRPEADFQLGGMEGPLTCPTSFQVSARRFTDGLGLDSFARSIGAVFKTQLEGIWLIQERLDDRPDDVTVLFDLSGPDMPQA